MCGRFTLTADAGQIQQAFPGFEMPPRHAARYNIAPSQPVLAIPNDGRARMTFFQWGLIPSWSKDLKSGYKMINARAETLAEKPAFRAAYRRRRCLILTDGFYEWQKQNGAKQPMYIHMQSGKPFAFAGLWEVWRSPEGDELLSATIVTTAPNELVRPIHNRMPVILPPEHYDAWLEPSEVDPAQLQSLLKPYAGDDLTSYAVSTVVNNPAHDSQDCIVPLNR